MSLSRGETRDQSQTSWNILIHTCQTRERKKPCSKSWLNTTAFTKCFHAAGQSEKRVSHKDTPTEAILHSPVSVCHRGHSSLYTLLRHCDFFQAENWILKQKTQQLIIQACFHSCHQIPQGAATLLLTYKPIFLGGPVSPRLFRPLGKAGRGLGWCRLMTETLSARSSPTWWSSRTDVQ